MQEPLEIIEETGKATCQTAAKQSSRLKGRGKPGNKPGAIIKRVPKLKDYRIREITGQIEIRSRESPKEPYSYAKLAEISGYSQVTLRNTPLIRGAMEHARKIAAEQKETCQESQSDLKTALQRLKNENNELKAELQWYRTKFQKDRILARENNNTDDASDTGT